MKSASQDPVAEAGIREEFQKWFFESRRKDTDGCMARFAFGLHHVTGETTDGRTVEMFTRGTWCWRKIDGKWRVIHQHMSAPFDPRTGKAALLLKP